MTPKAIVKNYIEGWKNGNALKILACLSEHCLIIESHGPSYRGKARVKAWVEDWKKHNSKVNSWNITSFYQVRNTVLFEWNFSCTVASKTYALEGISIATIANNKISYLREYRTTEPLYDWLF